MAFPTTFTNAQDIITEILAEHLNALETKVGVDGSADPNSLDYKINNLPSVSYSKSFVITNPTSLSDSPLWRTPVAITITAIHVLCIGGTNIVGMLDECDANGANPIPVDATDIAGIAGSNVNDDGSLSNPGIDAGDYIGWHTTSVSGTVTRVIITFDYTIV